MAVFTLSGTFWNVSVLHRGYWGTSNRKHCSAKQLLMGLKHIRYCLEIIWPATASTHVCQCCDYFLLPKEESKSKATHHSLPWEQCLQVLPVPLRTGSSAGARKAFGCAYWLGAITKGTPNSYGPYVRLSHHLFCICFASLHDFREHEPAKKIFLEQRKMCPLLAVDVSISFPRRGKKECLRWNNGWIFLLFSKGCGWGSQKV